MFKYDSKEMPYVISQSSNTLDSSEPETVTIHSVSAMNWLFLPSHFLATREVT